MIYAEFVADNGYGCSCCREEWRWSKSFNDLEELAKYYAFLKKRAEEDRENAEIGFVVSGYKVEDNNMHIFDDDIVCGRALAKEEYQSFVDEELAAIAELERLEELAAQEAAEIEEANRELSIYQALKTKFGDG